MEVVLAALVAIITAATGGITKVATTRVVVEVAAVAAAMEETVMTAMVMVSVWLSSFY